MFLLDFASTRGDESDTRIHSRLVDEDIDDTCLPPSYLTFRALEPFDDLITARMCVDRLLEACGEDAEESAFTLEKDGLSVVFDDLLGVPA